MSIRSRAITAHKDSQADRTAEALAAVTGVIGVQPAGEPPLEVEDTAVTSTVTLVVFTDGDVHIGTQDRGEGFTDVRLVEWRNGRWQIGPGVESLAQLGEVLPDFDPVDENAAPAYPAWDTGIAVKVGDRYTYGGFVWQVTQAHTTQAGWEPPNVPALWTKVAA